MSKIKRKESERPSSKKIDFNNTFHRDVHMLYVDCDNYDYAIQEVASAFLGQNINNFLGYNCQICEQNTSKTQEFEQDSQNNSGFTPHNKDIPIKEKSSYSKKTCNRLIDNYINTKLKGETGKDIFIVVTGEDLKGARYGGSLFEGSEKEDPQTRFFLSLDKAHEILSSQGVELSNFIITAIIRDYFQNICKERLMRKDIKDIRSIFATNVHAKMVNLSVSCAYPIIDKRSKKIIKDKLINNVEKDLGIKHINTNTIRLRHFIKHASTPLKQIVPKGYYKYYYRFKARPILSFCLTFLFIPIIVNIVTTIIFDRCVWECIKNWIYSWCS